MDSLPPLTLAKIKGRLEQVCDEIDSTFERTAFSPLISENRERGSGIFDGTNGDLIAQGRSALPQYIGIIPFVIRTIMETGEEVHSGDLFICNDPYSGGSTLLDITMVLPFFYRDDLFAFLACTGRYSDMGGRAVGGFAPRATDIAQEGLRLVPLKLYHQGKREESLVRLIRENSRFSEEIYGNLHAQVAALRVGERRLQETLEKYGHQTIESGIKELKKRGEELMRERIREIPDGLYHFDDLFDSDGIDDRPLKIALDLEVRGSEMLLDFSKSDRPCTGPMNSSLSNTIASCQVAMRHLFPEIPLNAGAFVPFTFAIPPTTFLHASFPRPVSGSSSQVSQRIVDVIFGALANVLPGHISGAAFSGECRLTLSGHEPQGGDYLLFLALGGGYGGSNRSDGLTNGPSPVSAAQLFPLELIEKRYPIVFEQYMAREGSGGAGVNRGGLGVIYEFRFTGENAKVTLFGERGRSAPFGVLGGGEGARSRYQLILSHVPYTPSHETKDEEIPLKKGDLIRIETPGGGGWRNPFERSIRLVTQDVNRRYITREQAKREYGVVLLDDSLDYDAKRTSRIRHYFIGLAEIDRL